MNAQLIFGFTCAIAAGLLVAHRPGRRRNDLTDSQNRHIYDRCCRRMEEMLRMDMSPVLVRREALLILEACHGRSHVRTLAWLTWHYIVDFTERMWLSLRIAGWALAGKDPYEELMRIAEEAGK